MAKFCLPKELTQRFLDNVKSKPVNYDTLAKMTPGERTSFFEDAVGKGNAKGVEELFEEDRSQSGAPLSRAEQDQIYKLSKNSETLKAKIKPDEPIGSPNRTAYGAQHVALQNFINDLKLADKASTFSGFKDGLKSDPLATVAKEAAKIPGIAKSIKASLDDSAIFRQGWKTLFTHPDKWAANSMRTFSDIAKQLGKSADNNDVLNAIKADLYSRPNALDGTYDRMKLDIGNLEEAYPSSLPEKIPLFGRLFKASETAYQGFLYRMRADIADKYAEIARENHIDLTDKRQAQSIGTLVNSLTGRGDLGRAEGFGKAVNTIFFSPKMLKSSFDFLTAHQLQGLTRIGNSDVQVTPFVRKQAAINLVKVVAGTAAILAVAKSLNPKSVETDPRSSDFGKIKIGDTRFDVTGGMDSLVTLAFRLQEQATKSTYTGKITQTNTGKFGSKTGDDLIQDFLTNKLSPVASVINDVYIRHEDFNYKKPTLGGEISNFGVPLSITNTQELLSDPNSADVVLSIIADGLGINTNTYKPTAKK